MSGKVTAWQLFDQVLRTFFFSLWRLPLLVLGTVIVYAAVWWLLLRDRSYAESFYPIDPIERLATIALIFPPLAVAVMRRTILGQTRLRDWWQPPVWRIAGLIFLALIALHLLDSVIVGPLIGYAITGEPVARIFWTLQSLGYVVILVAVGARLVWMVPAIAVDKAKSIIVAFREKRGNYRLAFLTCLLTVMPLYVFNYYFEYWSYTGSRPGSLQFQSELQAWVWLLKDGAVIACRCILLSVLAAVIYRAEFGSLGATAP